MTLTAFGLAAVGLFAGFRGDNPALIIFGFLLALIGFSLVLHRDWQNNAVAVRPQPAHWDTLDELLALPTAARGSYPEDENV